MKCNQYITYSANGRAYPEVVPVIATDEAEEPRILESGVLGLYPEVEYQTIEGFGGAMTETSAYLFSQMTEEDRREALQAFFGENGNHMTFIRVHMDSCDYSLEEYQAVENPVTDPEFETFSLKRDQKYILPLLKEAIAMSKTPISVLLSPWSPPACWKTPPARPKNDAEVYGGLPGAAEAIDYDNPSRCNGGSLKPEFYGQWAKYLTKFVLAYLEEGIPVTMMSLQNESVAATNWDSCVWTGAEQKAFLRDYMYPEFEKAGLVGKVGLYIWDHNKERMLEFTREIMDEETAKMIEGIAFHWYSGDHFEAVEIAGKLYPEKTLMLSECCGLHQPGKVGFMDMFSFGTESNSPMTVEYMDAVAYAHDMIGNLNAGMNRWIDWNFCVDKTGGPRHVPGGFTACMIVDEEFRYRKDLTYDYIGHFSRHILPGAKRIGFSRCDDKVEMTAAKNTDGSLVLVLLNKQNADLKYAIRLNGEVLRISLPARTISTLVISE